jgi:putative iron-dependent peroxidase
MTTPQPGITVDDTPAHHHLEYDLRPATGDATVRSVIAAARVLDFAVDAVAVVIGFGPALWARLAPGTAPPALGPFRAIDAGGRHAPATPHDAWVWVHGPGPDVVLDAARALTAALAPAFALAAEQPCFLYRDSRDLTGFIDGTENPPVEEAPGVAFVPAGEPGAGGACVVTIRWLHDLAAFEALPDSEQERIIGRTKPDSVELTDLPENSHVARVVITENGEELEIYRRSMPFGAVGDHGLYFVAFSADPTRFERILARMFGTAGDATYDRLTDFSRPVSGAHYFAPSLEDLASLAG